MSAARSDAPFEPPREPAAPEVAPLPPALLSRNPLAWLTVFGPGAIIASLTIGTGELIFSSRGGALFGYRILFLFVVISLLKWGLVFGASRHMVLTGVHPYRRMLDLPGPRGWLLAALLLLAAVCIPIWVSFHCGVLGNLTSWITGTGTALSGAADYLWGGAILAAVLTLSLAGGYSALERVQLAIVVAMVLCAGVTLVLYNPDWLALVEGVVVPRPLHYPPWIDRYPDIAAEPVWVETTRYAGVIGGAGFDYLAYVSFLRDKRWGRAGMAPASGSELDRIAADRSHPVRRWIRAPLIDCTVSFAVVIAFSAVFVASGALILGPEKTVPDEANLLNLQAAFVTRLHPWLLPLYVAGAFLAMLGTLYGTIEVGNAFARELVHAVSPDVARRRAGRIKSAAVLWCGLGAFAILGWLFLYRVRGGSSKPRLLLDILTPANLFTGVLSCGLLCLLVPWMDRRFLPPRLRPARSLLALELAAAAVFVALGMKGYWESANRWLAFGGLAALLASGILVAAVVARRGT